MDDVIPFRVKRLRFDADGGQFGIAEPAPGRIFRAVG